VATAALAIVGLSGCGFVAAGNKSSVKPSGFVLSGHAAVTLPSSDTDTVGTSCIAPAGATDVAKGVNVTVTNATGTRIATGHLAGGIVTRTGSIGACTFPFQIQGVPGSVDTYGISIGNRPATSFSGAALRASSLAVLTITPTPTP
jgi:hypothetical protein